MNRFHEVVTEFNRATGDAVELDATVTIGGGAMSVMDEIRLVQERNAADYEAVAQMTGQSVAEIEADTCAPDPGAEEAAT